MARFPRGYVSISVSEKNINICFISNFEGFFSEKKRTQYDKTFSF